MYLEIDDEFMQLVTQRYSDFRGVKRNFASFFNKPVKIQNGIVIAFEVNRT